MSMRSIVFLGAAADPVLQSNQAWADVLVLERHRSVRGRDHELCRDAYVLLLHLDASRLRLRARERADWVEATADSVSIMGDRARLEWGSDETGPLLAAAIRPMFLAAVADRAGMSLGASRSGAGLPDPGLAHVLSAFGAELAQSCLGGKAYWMALATALATLLLRQHAAGPPDPPPLSGGLAPARLQRVLDRIEAPLQEELCVADIARVAELGPSRFAAGFRKSTGMPPCRYAMHRRALRAKELLADPARPIADIAYALGYSSQAHFTTMFRRMTGVSPGAHRSGLAAPLAPALVESRNDLGSV
jgi:AraC-like DNA-binding protein